MGIFLFWLLRGHPDSGVLTVTFTEILNLGAKPLAYRLEDLTTVDALLDDIYQRCLQGQVKGGSYGVEWILVDKSGGKLWDIGSSYLERHGIPPEQGRRRPIDRRLIAALPGLFKPGGTVRVQRLEACSVPPPSRDPAEVHVTHPHDSIKTQTKKGRRYFEIVGTLKQLPADTEIWAFVKDISQPKWWPHGPAIVIGPNWRISRVNPGGGGTIRLQICLVGKSGQALIAYHRLVGAELSRLRGNIKKQFTSADVDELWAPAIADPGSDITFVHDKVVSVE
jgi:hypothetical protein